MSEWKPDWTMHNDPLVSAILNVAKAIIVLADAADELRDQGKRIASAIDGLRDSLETELTDVTRAIDEHRG